MGRKKRSQWGPGQNKKEWNAKEDTDLVKCLLELVNVGALVGNNNCFKRGTLRLLEKKMIAMKHTEIKGNPHISSRLRTIRKYYKMYSEVITSGGFEFNSETGRLEANDSVWGSVLQTDRQMYAMLHKQPLPHYNKLHAVCGCDQGTGNEAMSFADAGLAIAKPQSSRSVGATKKRVASPVWEPDGGSSQPSSKLGPSSEVPKHVSLDDWWLIRTETFSGHRNLGVGGLNTDPELGPRLFYSAAISKIHSPFVLEAFDGITITLVDSINMVRTVQNGFSHEVWGHFEWGFPYYWEAYAGADGSIPRAISSPNSFVPKSLNDIPICLMRHFAFSSSCQVYGVCELQKSVVKNIERTCENDHDDSHLVPPKEGNSQVTSIDSQEHEISIKNSNIDRQHQIKDHVGCRRSSRKNSRVIRYMNGSS